MTDSRPDIHLALVAPIGTDFSKIISTLKFASQQAQYSFKTLKLSDSLGIKGSNFENLRKKIKKGTRERKDKNDPAHLAKMAVSKKYKDHKDSKSPTIFLFNQLKLSYKSLRVAV
jgi:hypothetical protein